MRDRIPTLSLGVALALALVLGPATHQAGAAIPSGSISGTVTSASSGDPIENINVCAQTESAGGYCYGTTNANGEYTISGLPAGVYKVSFSAGYVCTLWPKCTQLNYMTQYYDRKSSPAEAEEVVVTAGSTTSRIDARMVEGGRITGTVTYASDGAPIEEIKVCPSPVAGEGVEHCAYTNANGEYTIAGLPGGSYKVEFARDSQCESPCPIQNNFITQFYNDKPSYGEAEAVPVTAGSTTSGVDARLVEGGRITGTVTSASGGGPIEEIDVCARPVSGGSYVNCGLTNTRGEYTIRALPSGSYDVVFSTIEACPSGCPRQNYLTQYYHGKSSRTEAEPVPVDAGITTSGIDAQMVTGGQIAGRVTNSLGENPIEGIEVCVPGGSEEPSRNCVATNANGEYTISALMSGSYQVEFSSEGGYNCVPKCAQNYVTQFYNNKPSLTEAEPVSVTAGSTTSGIDARMVEGPERLLGPLSGPPASTIGGGSRPVSPVGLLPVSAKISSTLSLDGSTITVQSRGKGTVKLTCRNASTCRGKLTLTAKTRDRDRGRKRGSKTMTIARATFAIPPGKTTVIELELNVVGRVLLNADHGWLKAILTVLKSSPAPSQTQTASMRLVQEKAAKGRSHEQISVG
jgi:hypothetical protein